MASRHHHAERASVTTGGRRSRHVSDPQPGLGGACRLEAAHSVPPEIRTCDRRPAKLTQSCRPFRDKFGLPLRCAARTAPRHRAITTHDSGRQRADDDHARIIARSVRSSIATTGAVDGQASGARPSGRPYSAPGRLSYRRPHQRTGGHAPRSVGGARTTTPKRAVSAVA
jgi:hypothetical protein